jgi:8-oxo-dGTP pyrophosphatase MutT (NUDIX family)/deoxyadenosine/deoxycytidine kinase
MLHDEVQLTHPPLFEAAGCICCCDGRVLLLQRTDEKSYPRRWGFPSGKLGPGEAALAGVIREMYEETHILVSSEQLQYVGTYFIVTEDLSFKYSTFTCSFATLPEVQITPSEHIRYDWFTPDAVLDLDLVPDVDSCLKRAMPQMHFGPYQLQLFRTTENAPPRSAAAIEEAIRQYVPAPEYEISTLPPREWYASFGPPGAGKTTALKVIEKFMPEMKLVEEIPAILNRNSRLNFYLKKAFEDDDPRFFFPFQIEVLPARYWAAASAPAKALVDGTIFTALAYSRALYGLRLLAVHEYETFYVNYLSYYRHFQSPRCVWYFHCDAATLQKRIKARSRRIERFYSLEYLNALCFAFNQTAAELARSIPIRRIDTSKTDTRRLALEQVRALYGL